MAKQLRDYRKLKPTTHDLILPATGLLVTYRYPDLLGFIMEHADKGSVPLPLTNQALAQFNNAKDMGKEIEYGMKDLSDMLRFMRAIVAECLVNPVIVSEEEADYETSIPIEVLPTEDVRHIAAILMSGPEKAHKFREITNEYVAAISVGESDGNESS